MEACLVVLRGRGGQPAEEPVYQPDIPDLWRVSDALARIRAALAEDPEGGALTRFLPVIRADAPHRELRARAAVASTLLAGLELAKEGGLTLRQESPFATLSLASLIQQSVELP
jgi:segregation and condensation protein A